MVQNGPERSRLERMTIHTPDERENERESQRDRQRDRQTERERDGSCATGKSTPKCPPDTVVDAIPCLNVVSRHNRDTCLESWKLDSFAQGRRGARASSTSNRTKQAKPSLEKRVVHHTPVHVARHYFCPPLNVGLSPLHGIQKNMTLG